MAALLILLLISAIFIGAISCAGETVSTPTPTPTITKTQLAQYPWKSIFISSSLETVVAIEGNILQVNVDMGGKSNPPDFTLIDETGKEYHAYMSGNAAGAEIAHSDQTGQEQIIWHADYAYIYRFAVESKSASLNLHWPGYPPIAIGNPFVSPFVTDSE